MASNSVSAWRRRVHVSDRYGWRSLVQHRVAECSPAFARLCVALLLWRGVGNGSSMAVPDESPSTAAGCVAAVTQVEAAHRRDSCFRSCEVSRAIVQVSSRATKHSDRPIGCEEPTAAGRWWEDDAGVAGYRTLCGLTSPATPARGVAVVTQAEAVHPIDARGAARRNRAHREWRLDRGMIHAVDPLPRSTIVAACVPATPGPNQSNGYWYCDGTTKSSRKVSRCFGDPPSPVTRVGG